MKLKFRILVEPCGSWEYSRGDIIGIDNRKWFKSGPDVYFVKNLKTSTTYKTIFKTKYAAKKFINRKHKLLGRRL